MCPVRSVTYLSGRSRGQSAALSLTARSVPPRLAADIHQWADFRSQFFVRNSFGKLGGIDAPTGETAPLLIHHRHAADGAVLERGTDLADAAVERPMRLHSGTGLEAFKQPGIVFPAPERRRPGPGRDDPGR